VLASQNAKEINMFAFYEASGTKPRMAKIFVYVGSIGSEHEINIKEEATKKGYEILPHWGKSEIAITDHPSIIQSIFVWEDLSEENVRSQVYVPILKNAPQEKNRELRNMVYFEARVPRNGYYAEIRIPSSRLHMIECDDIDDFLKKIDL